jgi:hypothetical protein
MENDAEILPAHYTWKGAEKGFKMACMMNKLAMINSCEVILEIAKLLRKSGGQYTYMHIILDKIQ